ncbi:acyl-CoA synthase [marine gamma proteobacterium HTCC2143]|uniref:Acyl-CoA synthase n=1 Tax=marine gamma proteobacterium HTCC2143 TaxID=247633 RepID=A0YFX0_9GAMM|nr:acyl-CoA synthase [marine gamma proteobacterium HTCC2143]
MHHLELLRKKPRHTQHSLNNYAGEICATLAFQNLANKQLEKITLTIVAAPYKAKKFARDMAPKLR